MTENKETTTERIRHELITARDHKQFCKELDEAVNNKAILLEGTFDINYLGQTVTEYSALVVYGLSKPGRIFAP